MSSPEKFFEINIYNSINNKNNDIDAIVPDEFLKKELPLEYKFKSGEIMPYDEKKDYILSIEEIKIILGKQTEKKHEISEGNNINNGIQEKNELKEEDNKNVHFAIIKKNNRGKAPKSYTKNKRLRKHSKNDSDNIRNKIKSHFLNFLISLANDITRNELKGKKEAKYFYNIEFKIKNKINLKEIYRIPYKDILTKFHISQNQGFRKNCKNYKVQKITNEQKYNEICRTFPLLKEFFEQKVSDVFEKYYCLNKKLNNLVVFENFTFELSPETETFYDLLKKNEEIEDELNKCKDKCINKY